ncbi:hypothetical protein E2C01_089210 [Portunus trituberculatus]|uniref:Uncharacterized protein n=1 Tax=Portunus trituberculatus TaxID=210409 RepID=A0A5B7JGM5_PORTR|nr:hypothetical protein [Portunus trituberculatus]
MAFNWCGFGSFVCPGGGQWRVCAEDQCVCLYGWECCNAPPV